MKLLLHIFRKDLRHFFPEILINLALFAAFAWTAPFSWPAAFGTQSDRLIPAVLRLLMPLAWLFLISRLVHDEPLAGDRQFWITRPYPWQVLLLEKLLFVIAFLNLPLLLTQVYLLHHAGFALTPALGDLLLYQLAVSALYLLPFTALAVICNSFGRHLLLLLGGLIYIALLGTLGNWITGPRMMAPYTDRLAYALALSTFAAVITLMYARRPLLQARLALLCLPVVAMLLFIVMPTTPLVRQAFAATNTGDTLTFDFDPRQTQTGSGEPALFEKTKVLLQLPLTFHGPQPKEAAVTQGVQLTLTAPDGFHWSSPYQGTQTVLQPGTTTLLGVQIPFSIYQRLAAQPVTLQLHAAITSLAPGPAQVVTEPRSGNLALPDRGLCTQDPLRTFLQCRYALRSPAPAEMHFEVQDDLCDHPSPRHDLPQYTLQSDGGLRLDFDPVVLQAVQLSLFDGKGRITPQYFCPGAHASFAPERQFAREVLPLTQTDLQLTQYVSKTLAPGPPEE